MVTHGDYDGWWLLDDGTRAECPDCGEEVGVGGEHELGRLLEQIDRHECAGLISTSATA